MIHFHDFKKNTINCEIFLVFSRPLNLRDMGILRSGQLEKREKKKRKERKRSILEILLSSILLLG